MITVVILTLHTLKCPVYHVLMEYWYVKNHVLRSNETTLQHISGLVKIGLYKQTLLCC